MMRRMEEKMVREVMIHTLNLSSLYPSSLR